MNNYQPLTVLPVDIQTEWRAGLMKSIPTPKGAFKLVNIRRTAPKSFEEQRLIVLVVDENGFPMPNVRVAFSYSTADFYAISSDFMWMPPQPQRAHIVPTAGSGQIEQIQGSPVKQGEAGGVTVYIFEPEYSSDVVIGLGMLADHTGLHLTFQLRRAGVMPLVERVAGLEARVAALEGKRGK